MTTSSKRSHSMATFLSWKKKGKKNAKKCKSEKKCKKQANHKTNAKQMQKKQIKKKKPKKNATQPEQQKQKQKKEKKKGNKIPLPKRDFIQQNLCKLQFGLRRLGLSNCLWFWSLGCCAILAGKLQLKSIIPLLVGGSLQVKPFYF